MKDTLILGIESSCDERSINCTEALYRKSPPETISKESIRSFRKRWTRQMSPWMILMLSV